MTDNVKPIVGVTMGDPAGVGPEIACKMFAEKTIYDFCRPLVVGDSACSKRGNESRQSHASVEFNQEGK